MPPTRREAQEHQLDSSSVLRQEPTRRSVGVGANSTSRALYLRQSTRVKDPPSDSFDSSYHSASHKHTPLEARRASMSSAQARLAATLLSLAAKRRLWSGW